MRAAGAELTPRSGRPRRNHKQAMTDPTPASRIPEPSLPMCKLCGGATSHLFARGDFEIVKCRSCGFMFALLPAGYDLNAVYRDDSYWNGGTDCGYQDYDEEWKASVRFYRARLARLKSL